MDAIHVLTVLCWMRRADREFADVTLSQLFRTAYYAGNGVILPESRLAVDLAEFAKGNVPYYVVIFMKKHIYPVLLKVNPDPKPPVIH